MRRLTLFAGDGVDTIGNGGLVRRVLGLKTAFGKPCDLRSCEHAWSTNEYIRSFEGSQFRCGPLKTLLAKYYAANTKSVFSWELGEAER